MEPITELSQNVTTLQAGVAAARRIQDVEELAVEADPPEARRDRDAPPARRTGGAVLELRDVTAGYGEAMAMREVSLAVPRCGHVAIVGPSGAGKTTLLSLIMRFLEPTSGTLLIEGVPYAAQTYSAVRARLAYVEQDTPVVPDTIRDNLLFTHPDATDEDVRRVLAEVRLDEATAQVDGLTERAIQECIRRRAAESAVVTVAHRLSTVIDADEIVVLDGGRIRARGTHEAPWRPTRSTANWSPRCASRTIPVHQPPRSPTRAAEATWQLTRTCISEPWPAMRASPPGTSWA